MNLSQDELNSMLEYDPLTGILTWKDNRSNMIKGSIAGSLNCSGYKTITINSKTFRVQRIIWIMMFGHIPNGFFIDHINGNKLDNRLENLRFLCPNCHSQTDSYCGKKLKKSKNCLCCGVPVFKTSEKCRKCESISRFNNKTKIIK